MFILAFSDIIMKIYTFPLHTFELRHIKIYVYRICHRIFTS